MKNLMLIVVLAAGAISSSVNAHAQFGGELNVAHADSHWGGELGLGYSIPLGKHVSKYFRIVPAGGIFLYSGGNDTGYYEDNNGGNPRCRDASNGEYADSGDCSDIAATGYGRAEGTFLLPKRLSLGAGGRFSSAIEGYGILAYQLAHKVNAKADVGPNYYAFGLALGF